MTTLGTVPEGPPVGGIARERPDADRTARFIARIDSHLPTLADAAARRAFLDRQLEGWEHRYARFLATEGASEPGADSPDPPQAADFLLTIAALATRLARLRASSTRYGAKFRSAPMPDTDNPVGAAILSLLVAADQRCPAIIGQAHLLYYARFGTAPDAAEKTFAQLQRDAEDLCKAIADVQAAFDRDASPQA